MQYLRSTAHVKLETFILVFREIYTNDSATDCKSNMSAQSFWIGFLLNCTWVLHVPPCLWLFIEALIPLGYAINTARVLAHPYCT